MKTPSKSGSLLVCQEDDGLTRIRTPLDEGQVGSLGRQEPPRTRSGPTHGFSRATALPQPPMPLMHGRKRFRPWPSNHGGRSLASELAATRSSALEFQTP